MYAIVQIQGKQFKVEQGLWILVPKTDKKEGDTIIFDQVMVFNNDKDILIGQPFLDNVNVQGKIVQPEVKAKKIIVFKYKKRKDYRRKQGHRQKYTKIMIESIQLEAKKPKLEAIVKTSEKVSKTADKPSEAPKTKTTKETQAKKKVEKDKSSI